MTYRTQLVGAPNSRDEQKPLGAFHSHYNAAQAWAETVLASVDRAAYPGAKVVIYETTECVIGELRFGANESLHSYFFRKPSGPDKQVQDLTRRHKT